MRQYLSAVTWRAERICCAVSKRRHLEYFAWHFDDFVSEAVAHFWRNAISKSYPDWWAAAKDAVVIGGKIWRENFGRCKTGSISLDHTNADGKKIRELPSPDRPLDEEDQSIAIEAQVLDLKWSEIERDVLRLLIDGRTPLDIADILSISALDVLRAHKSIKEAAADALPQYVSI